MDDPGDAGTQEIADNLLTYMKVTLKDASLAYDGPVTRLLGGMDNTIYRFQVNSSGIWGQELASTDWDDFLQRYLQLYREHQTLDTTHLDYYGVLAIVFGLIPFLGDAGRPVEPLFGDDITESFTRDVNSFI
jgi:hypothetical protein